MSTKRMARSVYDGKLLTFRLPDGGAPITGYLAGMDAYHWRVLSSDCDEHLIHKAGATVSVASESTYRAEPRYSDLEEVIRPFRERLTADGMIPARPRPHSTASERTA